MLNSEDPKKNSDSASIYNTYYLSGAYRLRYPHCNSRMMRAAANIIKESNHILDFGCGNGRYTIPLLTETTASIVAFDISHIAIDQIREATLNHPRRNKLQRATGPSDSLSQYGPFDIVLCIFGVLSHVPTRAHRIAMLRRLHGLLKSDANSRLLVSVPNATRRFTRLQKRFNQMRLAGADVGIATESGDIMYERNTGSSVLKMFYHMYTPSSLAADLVESGFSVKSMFSESTLPESLVIKYPFFSSIDDILCDIFPINWSYGIGAIGTK